MIQYTAHPSAIIDDHCEIGEGTKIWHFSHIMTGCKIGKNCNIGQNVVVSPQVVLGENVKVQNNVSIYTGVICEDDVFLGPSAVFTNVPASVRSVSGEAAKRTVMHTRSRTTWPSAVKWYSGSENTSAISACGSNFPSTMSAIVLDA